MLSGRLGGLLVCALVSLANAGTADAAISLVKEVGTASSSTLGTTLTITVPATGVARGDTIILFAGTSGSNNAVSTVTDSRGNAYTVDVRRSSTASSVNTNIVSAPVTTALVGGDTIKVTFNDTMSIRLALATQWRGLATTGRLDRTATSQSSGTSLSSGTTGATTQASELVLGSFSAGENATFTATGGATAFATQLRASLGSTFRTQWQSYRIVSAKGTYSATGTASRSSLYAGAIATYREQTQAPDTTTPSTPSPLAAGAATMTSIPLTWGASTDDVAVTGYRIDKAGIQAGTTTQTGYTVTGLTCGTAYALTVRAYDAATNLSAPASITASTAPCDTTPPSAPPGLSAGVATRTSVPITWGPSSDDVGVTGYRVAKDGITVGTTTQTSFTVTGLSCGASAAVDVSAIDAAGNVSAPSSITVTAAECDVSAPSTPAPGVSAVTTTSISIAWMTSLDDVGVVGYGLYLDGTPAGSTTGTTATFAGLACGTTHTLTVDAVDAAGNRSAQGSVDAATSACDITEPAVAVSAPSDGSTVSGAVSVSASASDDVAVASVQLRVDDAALGSAQAAPPYSASWNTNGVANGSHVLTAVATDTSGNSATSAPVTVTVTNTAPTTPTPVPAADTPGITLGNGLVDASTREVIRTAGNAVYAIVADDDTCQGSSTGRGVIHAYRGTGAQAANASVPTGFTEADAANRPVSRGAGDCTYSVRSVLQSPDVRLDSSGIAHVTYIDGFDGAVYYQTFSTVTNTWGARTSIGTGGQLASAGGATWPREGNVALTLDAADQPHVVYATNGTANQIVERTRSGGVWSAATVISSGSTAIHPSLATALDGTIHAAWLTNSFSASPSIMYARRAGSSWSTPELVSAGDTKVLSDANSDQGPSVATDASSQPHVMYMDGTPSGNDDYVRMRYRTTVGAWTDNTPPGGAGGASNPSAQLFAHTPQVYVSGSGGVFAFLGHDNHTQFGYQYQLGGPGTPWARTRRSTRAAPTNPAPGDTIEPGPDGSASIRFDPLRDTNTRDHRHALLRRARQRGHRAPPRDGVLQGDRDRPGLRRLRRLRPRRPPTRRRPASR